MTTETIVSVASASIPTLAVLIGILLNEGRTNRLHADNAALRVEMNSFRSEVRSEINGLRGEIHTGIVSLLNRDQDHEIRLLRLEDKG